MYFLLGLPILLLLLPLDMFEGSACALVYVLVATLLTLKLPKISIPKKIETKYAVPSVLVSFVLGFACFYRILRDRADILMLNRIGIVITILVVVVLLCAFSIHAFLSFYASSTKDKTLPLEINLNKKSINWRHITLIGVLSVLAVTLFSMNSPLYSFNDSYDINIYMTIGRGATKGMIPYRDLYDHKGPYIFLLYTIAAYISPSTFIGVGILEIINTFCYLFLFYKTLQIYMKNNVIFMLPLVILATFSSFAFLRGGTAEEFCLPFLMYGVYTSIVCSETKKIPDVKTGLLVGITSGCVFWVKFTVLGIYFGWIIVPLVIAFSDKKFKEFLKLLGSIVVGVFVSTIPYLIYYSYNNALKDLFKVYFYDNLFIYNDGLRDSTIQNKLVRSIIELLMSAVYGSDCISRYSFICFILIVIGLFWCTIRRDKLVTINMICSLCFSFALIFFGVRTNKYYALIFVVYMVYGVIACYKLFELISKKASKNSSMKSVKILLPVLILVLMLLLSPNVLLIGKEKSYYPQYKIAELINNSGITNPTILNYGYLDAGFYFTTQSIPVTKYFHHPNMSNNKDLDEEQNRIVNEGEVDFVVTEAFDDEITANLDKYTLVDSFYYFNDEQMRVFRLFQKQLKT